MDVESRRTIEALRAGVPSQDAVRQLGCDYPEVERRFLGMLEACGASVDSGVPTPGMLISGDFGAGKSHVLQCLQHIALERNFVVSKVVISKETSLADPVRVFEAAAAEARVAGRLGAGLQLVAQTRNFQSPEYSDFFAWAGSAGAALTPHLSASLYVYQHGRDPEYSQTVLRYWAGGKLPIAALKQNLQSLGQLSAYDLRRAPLQKELALQRFRFAARLVAGAGYAGWVLLLDEVELVGQYGVKQRARSYQELARLCGRLGAEAGAGFPGLATVAAMTSDFELSVLTEGKCDEEKIPNRYRATGRPDDADLAARAERGIQFILQERQPLPALTSETVTRTHEQLRDIYSRAFAWDAPGLAVPPIRTSAVMRPLVRRWIAEWDLLRLFPGETPQIEETTLAPISYNEDPDLDRSANQSFAAEDD